ncbi:MAG: hypothetical protein ACTHLC_07395 [Rhizobiaceae bacterium]
MKSLLIAAALTVGMAPVTGVASQAASVTIRTDNDHYDHYRHEHYDHGLHRGWYVGHHRGWREARDDDDDCRIRTVKTYRHHKVIIRKTRICD